MAIQFRFQIYEEEMIDRGQFAFIKYDLIKYLPKRLHSIIEIIPKDQLQWIEYKEAVKKLFENDDHRRLSSKDAYSNYANFREFFISKLELMNETGMQDYEKKIRMFELLPDEFKYEIERRYRNLDEMKLYEILFAGIQIEKSLQVLCELCNALTHSTRDCPKFNVNRLREQLPTNNNNNKTNQLKDIQITVLFYLLTFAVFYLYLTKQTPTTPKTPEKLWYSTFFNYDDNN